MQDKVVTMINFYKTLPLFVVLLCTACANQKSNEQSETIAYPTAKVGMSMSAIATNAFFNDMYESAKGVMQQQPSLTLLLEQADNDQNKQYQQLDDMLQQGAKALVVNLADVSQGQAFVEKYCKKGVPVVYLNRNPGDKYLASCDTAYFVDGDANQAGVLQGLQVLEKWKANPDWDKNKDGAISYALLEGIPNHAGTMARTKWSISTMQNYPSLGIPVRQVFSDTAMFQQDKASEVVENWISQPNFGDVEVILANNDNMAIGAIDTLKKHNIKLPVFGIDGGKVGLELVKSGDMSSTVFNDYDNQVKTALRMAANLATNQPVMNGINYRMEYKIVNVPYQNITLK